MRIIKILVYANLLIGSRIFAWPSSRCESFRSLFKLGLISLIASPLAALAQDPPTLEPFFAEIPEKFEQARIDQQDLAEREGVLLHRFDEVNNSSSAIEGVPNEFRSLRIYNAGDV